MTSTQQSKTKRRKAPETMTPAVLDSLKKAHAAHMAMKRVEQLCREAEAGRRAAVADAWKRGATAKEIAATLEISVTKAYALLPVGRKA
jgi:hypothetical protein